MPYQKIDVQAAFAALTRALDITHGEAQAKQFEITMNHPTLKIAETCLFALADIVNARHQELEPPVAWSQSRRVGNTWVAAGGWTLTWYEQALDSWEGSSPNWWLSGPALLRLPMDVPDRASLEQAQTKATFHVRAYRLWLRKDAVNQPTG